MSDVVVNGVRKTSEFVRLYQPTPINGQFHNKHVITVEQFARPDLQRVMDVTHHLRERVRQDDRTVLNLCATKVMATLFYEASTRTDMSFQAAIRRLGGGLIVASNGVQFSSVYKGENLADTLRAVGCYADVITLRHPEVGSSYKAAYYLDKLTERLGHQAVVISGGDGVGEHPTQALLDLFTILDNKKTVDGLTITLVGDLKHGRTVHSLAKLLAIYKAKNTRLCFVSPNSLKIPQEIVHFMQANDPDMQLYETTHLNDVLSESDVIYWTRVQEERFANPADYEAIRDDFIMLPAVLQQTKPDAILMHPLPRKTEMGSPADHDILDEDPRAIYFNQMENGMFVRMALLALVLGCENL